MYIGTVHIPLVSACLYVLPFIHLPPLPLDFGKIRIVLIYRGARFCCHTSSIVSGYASNYILLSGFKFLSLILTNNCNRSYILSALKLTCLISGYWRESGSHTLGNDGLIFRTKKLYYNHANILKPIEWKCMSKYMGADGSHQGTNYCRTMFLLI